MKGGMKDGMKDGMNKIMTAANAKTTGTNPGTGSGTGSGTGKQAYNPFLPLDVCIPDGEPHVYGDRVYLAGSHDEEGGTKFCPLGYEIFSAPVDDLTDWSSKGINYSPEDDPSYGDDYNVMYAPDVVQGNDGRFYLYYAMSGTGFTGPVRVAVCDTPDGRYRYYGEVRNPDGSTYTRKITFDPAVINDNGTIRLYYGWSLAVAEEKRAQIAGSPEALYTVQSYIFGKTREEIEAEPDGIMGAFEMELADDMLTVISEPSLVAPGQFGAAGTSFEGHAFFEGSSIRKINGTYYFIYSSENQHELCYATSGNPGKGFVFRGTIISNGDIGINGRKPEDRLAATANNHGSIAEINGQWYVFYHIQTHGTNFSRKACAEKISILDDGSIPQVEMTSCGLNDGPLKSEGTYPAGICCNLTNGHMPHLEPMNPCPDCPCLTSVEGVPFLTNITDGTKAVYKHFAFTGKTAVTVTYRKAGGKLTISAGASSAAMDLPYSADWAMATAAIDCDGVQALALSYSGEGSADLLEISF